MNTSIYISHYRKRIHIRQWRRGLRMLLVGILLMCMLSAGTAPCAVRAAEAEMPPEMTEMAGIADEVSDDTAPNVDIITQEEGADIDIPEESVPTNPDREIQIPPTPEASETITGISADTGEPGETGDPTEVTPDENMAGTGADAGELTADTDAPAADAVTAEEMMRMQAQEPMLLASPEPVVASAQNTTWQRDYYYAIDQEAGTLTVTRYEHYGYYGTDSTYKRADITIPSTATIAGVTYRTAVKNGVFKDCPFIRSVTFEDGVTVTGTSLDDMFRSCTSLAYVDLSGLDTTGVESTSRMFANCINLKSLDLSAFDMSAVTQMEQMFTNCYRLESLNVRDWDTSNCIDMRNLFADCMSLKSLDLSGWDTRKAVGSTSDSEGGTHAAGSGMEGMFSVGLEELTLGADCAFLTSSSGLLGRWSDGTETYEAAALESRFAEGAVPGTYTRVDLGGSGDVDRTREQAQIALLAEYKSTDELLDADQKDTAQRNGQISDPGKAADGVLIKTAEWTDKRAREADITLTYAVPVLEETRAVYAFGTCNVHGFGADVAIMQMLELLDHYDYVDALTARTSFPDSYTRNDSRDNYLANASMAMLSLSAADGRAANLARLIEWFTPDYLEYPNGTERMGRLTRPSMISWGSHKTATLLPSYLEAYLADYEPAAIYVSCDGSRAFSNDSSEMGRETALQTLYGVGWGEEAYDTDYDDLLVNADTIRTLAQYQADGRYYVCICKVQEGYTKAYYEQGGSRKRTYPKESRLLCYASFALLNPYYYVHHNAELREYLSGTTVKNYAEFETVGRELLNYGASYNSQGIDYVTTPVTISDTVDDGFVIDEEHIRVSITVDGVEQPERAGIVVTVEGQNVQIYLPGVSTTEVVQVHIPVTTAATDRTFYTEGYRFRTTNVGEATAATATGRTVSVASPRLFQGEEYTITAEVLHGTISGSLTEIPRGEDREVTYVPDEGYHIASITVDGVEVDPAVFGTGYTFTNITEDHVIQIAYEEDTEPEEPKEPDDPGEDPKTPSEDTGDGTRHESGHHKKDSKTTSGGDVNAAVVNVAVTDPTQAPEVTAAAVPEPAGIQEGSAIAGAGPATGDDTQMMLWLALTAAGALALLAWIAYQVRQLEHRD